MKFDREKIRATMKQYGFATTVVGALALMALLILGKDLTGLGKAGPGTGGPPGAGAHRPGGPGMELPVVEAADVGTHVFSDSVQALGTAQARESITITSKVQDAIRTIKFDSGQRVEKGQVLIELASVEQQADLKEARANLEADKRTYERIKELFDRGFAPRSRLEEAQAAYERSQAQVAAQESRIADRTIRAPFAGIVGLRTASPGELASPGQSLGTLDDVSIIKLDFDVPEPLLAKMKHGAPLEAKTPAYPNVKFSGTIDEIDSRVNPATRTVRVRALLPNKDGRIKPGMLMTVAVLSNRQPALAIPEMALTELGDEAYVYKLDREGPAMKVSQVYIKPGRRTDGFIEVLDGLTLGDKVIVEGVQRVRPGQMVKVKGADQGAGKTSLETPEDMGGGGAFMRGRS
jgi:membrane fusion protein (multidrug efflux system)